MGRPRVTLVLSSDFVMGQVDRSWLIRAWAQSRAADLMSDSLMVLTGGRGFVSLQRRLPRSNVYGMGLATVTGRRGLEPVDTSVSICISSMLIVI